jgi:sulfate/thiosulfate transport system substrate-binding protein
MAMWARVLLGLIVVYVVAAGIWVVRAGFGRNEQLLNVACDPTRELWHDLNAAFVEHYEGEHGVKLLIRQSHGGSGSQARAVIDGLAADIATLALWTDTDAIRKAGLIDEGWESRYPNRSLPYTSTIVFVVRKGNPKNIRDWTDLKRPDVEIITPNPKTSGNGKWSFLALWGSVVWRGGTEEAAREFVTRAYKQVPVLDAAARGATVTFAQKALGDVHLTWENEAHLEVKEAEDKLEIVFPGANTPKGAISVLAEPHVAVVDSNVRRKGTEQIADAYVRFLYTEEAQELIAKNFHRPFDQKVFARHKLLFPEMELRRATTLVASGNWNDIQQKYFAEGQIFDQIQTAGRQIP